MPENAGSAHLTVVSRGSAHTYADYTQGFIYACEAEGKAATTIEGYSEALRRFSKAGRALEFPSEPSLITRQHVRRYLAYLREDGSSPRTINDRLKVIRVWFRWLRAEGLVDDDPTEGVKRMREESKILATVTPAQVQDLLKVCERAARKGGQAKRKAERDKALILLLYNTGLRASELVGLDLADVNFESLLVKVLHGKGRKQRTVWLGHVPRQALWRYVTHVRGQETGPLFPSKRGGRLLRTSVTQLLTKLALKTDWQDKKCHPHMFRRAFAVEFLRAGGDPFRLQMLLGHAKLDMTRLYSQALSMDDALSAHEKYGPADHLTPEAHRK